MKKRLLKFLAYLKIGQNAFEKKAGLSTGYINKCTGNMEMKTLDLIENAFPELNMEWLKYGEEYGEMLKKSEPPPNQKPNTEQREVDRLWSMLDAQKHTIESLIKSHEHKDDIIAHKDKLLEKREKRIEYLLDELKKLNAEGAQEAYGLAE